MDDDSDDDDLLTQPTFRKKRGQQQTATRRANLLDQALDDSEQHVSTLSQMSAYRRESTLEEEEIEMKAPTQKSRDHRKTLDAMEGMDEEEDVPFDRKRRLQLQNMRDTEQASNLGIRAIVNFDPARAHGLLKVFDSDDAAISDLERILKKVENDNKSFKPLVEYLRKNLELCQLASFLEGRRIAFRLTKLKIPYLHFEITGWLIRTAQSHCELAEGALATLLELRKANQLKDGKDTTSLETFLESLTCWIPLRSPGTIESGSSSSQSNPRGLVALLSYWEVSLPHVTLFRPDTASRCMVALAMLGIDRHTVSSNRGNNAVLLKRTIQALLELVAKNLDDSKLEEWMERSARAILQDVGSLGPGLPKAEDADDTNAWLCHAALVRAIPQVDSSLKVHELSCRFKIHLAIQATAACLTELGSASFDETLVKRLTQSDQLPLLKLTKEDRAWYAFMSAYVALLQLELKSELHKPDASRILALVECAIQTFHAGLDLLRGKHAGSNEYGSKENAKTFITVLDLWESVSVPLASRASALANNPHYRRVDYTLKVNHHHVVNIRAHSSQLAGIVDMDNSPVQKKLTSFFTQKKAVSPT